jgi:hypothetical protein
MAEQLPSVVRELLARHIRSVEQLEVLLLLQGEPNRSWSAADVYAVIRSSESSIAQRLNVFTKEGFLAEEKGPPPSYRFAPRSGDLQAAVEATAAAYRTWRIRVVEAIFAPPSDPVQSFADAFRLRKD